MQTLSYGVKKPENPDTGDTFFKALEDNAQLQNDHTHNGTNSAPLATLQQTVLAANWVASGGSPAYRQLLTVPTGLQYDTCQIWARRSTGEQIYPDLRRVSSTTFYFYNANTTDQYTVNYR
jgi:hypothetical protein